MFSKDINMHFGLEKCAQIHIEKGKIKYTTKMAEIPLFNVEDSYKYLRIC